MKLFYSLLCALFALGCSSSNDHDPTVPQAGAAGEAGAAASGAGAGGFGANGGSGGAASNGSDAAVDGGDASEGPDPDVSDAGPSVVDALEVGDDFNAASDAALRRFSALYDLSAGRWTTGPRWSWALGVEASLANYERGNGLLAPYLFVETYERQRGGNFIDDLGYDDEAWWANVWVRAFDDTGDPKYLAMAKSVFADLTTAWEPNTCQGGIWWNRNRDYKNAITNELFMLTAAYLHNRTPGDTEYLEWATRTWEWFAASGGMINEENLIDDGLTNACVGNGQTTWTYNQGVILGALAELFVATSDAKYIEAAQRIADAAISKLVSDDGILEEPCEASANCNDDQSNFKGVFQRNLLRLHEVQPKPEYAAFLYRNAHSVWFNARSADDSLGNIWSGPFDKTDAQRQSSGLQALHAQAPPWSANLTFLRASASASFNHEMGRPVGTLAWRCDPASCPSVGVMQDGPFVAYLPAGSHTAHFQLAASRLSDQPGMLAELEVRDETTGAAIASLPVLWSDFRTARVPQDFAVPYRVEAAGHAISFRVIWQSLSGAPALTVTDVSVDQPLAFSAANLDHKCGRLDVFQHWAAERHRDTETCVLASGPGIPLPAGPTSAHFELKLDNFNLDDETVVSLAVHDRTAAVDAAQLTLTRKQFPNTLFQDFALEFTAEPDHIYDFVVTWHHSELAPRVTLRGVYVNAGSDESIALPFDTRGIGNAAADGDLDGVGGTFAAQWLRSPTTIAGQRFVFGPTNAGALNVLEANGQTLALSGKSGHELALLVVAVNGDQDGLDFTVRYGDGTSEVVTRSVSDWVANAPGVDESYAVAAPTRWSSTGLEYGDFHLFRVVVPLHPDRELQSLVLPTNPDLKIFAATLSSSN